MDKFQFIDRQQGMGSMGNSMKSAAFLIESRIVEAGQGKVSAYFDLGVAYSTGSGVDYDLVEAHKWFNLAALGGSKEGQMCRAEISGEMTREEISEAQRQARAWLDGMARPAMQHRYAA